MNDQLAPFRRHPNPERMLRSVFSVVETSRRHRDRRRAWLAVAASLVVIALSIGIGYFALGRQQAPQVAGTPTARSTATSKPSASASPQSLQKLPRIAVGHQANSNINVAPIQRFADDLADGNVEALEAKCWTIRPALRSTYRELATRQTILAALASTPVVLQHSVTYGNVVVRQDAYGLDYQCAINEPANKVADEELADVKYLLARYAGVLSGNPINPADHHVPLCADFQSAYFVAGELTAEGKAAIIALGTGKSEGTPSSSPPGFVLRPQGKSGPTLTYVTGALCFATLTP